MSNHELSAIENESFDAMAAEMVAYNEFLKKKIVVAEARNPFAGDVELHPALSDHAAAMVRWSLRQGRGLVAASFGMHKTRQQCEIARQMHLQSNRPFLQVCPLNVRPQFTHEDGPALGLNYQYVRTDAEIEDAESPYLITNYERVRDGDIDPRKHDLAGVSLDEGNVLRSMGTKTCDVFLELFWDMPNRYVFTATPSPNKFRELIYYAQWLGIMDVGQSLTRFFMRNPNKAGDLNLIPHEEENFWLWVASWALFVYTPGDLGFSDEGYDLPELKIHWHRLEEEDYSRAQARADDRGQFSLVPDNKTNVSTDAQERRATMSNRIGRMQELIAQVPGENVILWHNIEDEREAIEDAVPGVVSIYGQKDIYKREQEIIDFGNGKIQYLATKPCITGTGCNWQRHCHTNIYVGLNDDFDDFIQSVHRTYRFQQQRPVDVHIIYSETQDAIIARTKAKWRQYDLLRMKMQGIMRKFGMSQAAIRGELQRRIGVDRDEMKGDCYTAVYNDSVQEVRALPGDSIGLWHTSIPFGNHYEYTVNIEDFGHNPSDEAFFEQMDFLIPEMLRTLKPGRIAAIHVKDRILYGHQTASGIMEVAPFSDQTVAAFRKHGFLYEGRITVATDVVRENNSSYRLSYTEMCNDGSKMSCGLPEYVLIFRRAPSDTGNARADEPVTKSNSEYSLSRWQLDAHSIWRSNGNHLVVQDYVRSHLYDFDAHVARLEAKEAAGTLSKKFLSEPPEVNHPAIWDDIFFMRCLNANQVAGGKVKHLCPLPLDIVKRCILRWSNPGDIVGDPFGGIGTVPYVAVEQGRIGWSCELNHDYWTAACSYLRQIEMKAQAPTLFDSLPEVVEFEVPELAEVA